MDLLTDTVLLVGTAAIVYFVGVPLWNNAKYRKQQYEEDREEYLELFQLLPSENERRRMNHRMELSEIRHGKPKYGELNSWMRGLLKDKAPPRRRTTKNKAAEIVMIHEDQDRIK